MMNQYESLVVLALSVAASFGFMWLLDQLWPREKRREHNDQIGWQLTALGTTYAVILGFMLYAVWSTFGAAELNADTEADSLVNLYRIAAGLPEPQSSQLQQLAKSYAQVVINEEWPQMAKGELPEESRALNREMWKTIISIRSATPTQIAAEDHALTELSVLTECRRTRILQSKSRLPGVLWGVLLIGGILTVASACLFGSANPILHGLQVFAFSLLIALGLVAITDINSPFQGAIHVSTFAFDRAQENMRIP